MKTWLTIAGLVIAGIVVVAWKFMSEGTSGLEAGLKAANDSIDNSKKKIATARAKRVEEIKKIRGTSEKDSVTNLNSLDRD